MVAWHQGGGEMHEGGTTRGWEEMCRDEGVLCCLLASWVYIGLRGYLSVP